MSWFRRRRDQPDTALADRVAELGPWEQGPFELPGGVVAGAGNRSDARWQALRPLLPGTLRGLRALDVGTGAGYTAFALRREEAEVMAIDRALAHARLLDGVWESGIDFRELEWPALDPERHGRFAIVHCGGLLVREPAPLLLLMKLRELVAHDGRLILGAPVADHVRFLGGPDEWWVPDEATLAAMLTAAGFSATTTVEWEGERLLAAEPAAPSEALRAAAQRSATEVVVRSAPGHYYSPMPDAAELMAEPRHSQIWPPAPRPAPGVDWNDGEQLRLCREVFARQPRLALAADASEDPTEYFASNDQYPPLDAWLLEAILLHLRPARMIEIGSGFSSLHTARVNRELLGGEMAFTCIEPYPRQFLLDGVPGISDLRVEKIQDTPLEVFDTLGDGDVLFIDTSHTVKTGGDVPFLFGQVLPRLAPGVAVHVHDVFLPGDYPEHWVAEGWGWNENYLVHAFLAFNAGYEIMAGAQYLLQQRPEVLRAAFPGLQPHWGRGGGALWMRRRDAGRG